MNSLNISTNCPKQLKKINAIASLNSDIIFLSDTRLNTNTHGPCADLENIFLYTKGKQYNFHYNSKGSSRGVGILISTKVNINVIDMYRDDDDNILGVLCESEGAHLLLISVYGHNTNNNSHIFFDNINQCISRFKNAGCIIGGDWNLTYSANDSIYNIDIHNMAGPPSVIRSLQLGDICGQHHLSDPYRILYPERRDFTFQPRTRRTNRSRLDFFLISDCLIDTVKDCTISTGLTTELFDHKPVHVIFGKVDKNAKNKIDNCIFMHPRIMDVIAATTMDTYSHHQNNIATQAALNDQVGNLLLLLRNINDQEMDLAMNGVTQLGQLTLEGLVAQLVEGREQYTSPDVLSAMDLNCEDDTFFEVLIGNIKDSILSFQGFQKKKENIKVNMLTVRIDKLRDNFIENHQVISELETQLNGIIEGNISKKIANMKLFEGLHSEKPSPLFLSLAKKRNTGKLANIKQDSGLDFRSDEVRQEFIDTFYTNLYKKQVRNVQHNPVEEFLGEEICNSDLVSNSKLTMQESDNLEAPLTIEELDKSINDANMKSAPGIDGFSNALIKKSGSISNTLSSNMHLAATPKVSLLKISAVRQSD